MEGGVLALGVCEVWRKLVYAGRSTAWDEGVTSSESVTLVLVQVCLRSCGLLPQYNKAEIVYQLPSTSTEYNQLRLKKGLVLSWMFNYPK